MTATEGVPPIPSGAQSGEFVCPVCTDPFDRDYCDHTAEMAPLAKALCVHFQGDEENWGDFLDDAEVLLQDAGPGPAYKLTKLDEDDSYYEWAFVLDNLIVVIPPGGKDTKGDPQVIAKLPDGVRLEVSKAGEGVSDTLGFVVVEWNQASYQPDLQPYGCLFDDQATALEVAQTSRADARSRGRRERYTVHAVMAEEIEEGT